MGRLNSTNADSTNIMTHFCGHKFTLLVLQAGRLGLLLVVVLANDGVIIVTHAMLVRLQVVDWKLMMLKVNVVVVMIIYQIYILGIPCYYYRILSTFLQSLIVLICGHLPNRVDIDETSLSLSNILVQLAAQSMNSTNHFLLIQRLHIVV